MIAVAVGRRFSSIKETTQTLRRNSFKPDTDGEGPRVWKRVRNDRVERAEIEVSPSGTCLVTISMD